MPKVPFVLSEELPVGKASAVIANPADFDQMGKAEEKAGAAMSAAGDLGLRYQQRMNRARDIVERSRVNATVQKDESDFLNSLSGRSDYGNFPGELPKHHDGQHGEVQIHGDGRHVGDL